MTADLLETLQGLTAIVEKHATEPYGPPATGDLRTMAGQACVTFCEADQDKARSLWKAIANDSGGYMPFVVASALVRAARGPFFVPDVEAPDPT